MEHQHGGSCYHRGRDRDIPQGLLMETRAEGLSMLPAVRDAEWLWVRGFHSRRKSNWKNLGKIPPSFPSLSWESGRRSENAIEILFKDMNHFHPLRILHLIPPWQGWWSLTPASNALTPVSCPMSQLNSDTIYLERASDPIGEGLSLIRLSPYPLLQMSITSPGCQPASDHWL